MVVLVVRDPPASAGDMGLDRGPGHAPGPGQFHMQRGQLSLSTLKPVRPRACAPQ